MSTDPKSVTDSVELAYAETDPFGSDGFSPMHTFGLYLGQISRGWEVHSASQPEGRSLL